MKKETRVRVVVSLLDHLSSLFTDTDLHISIFLPSSLSLASFQSYIDLVYAPGISIREGAKYLSRQLVKSQDRKARRKGSIGKDQIAIFRSRARNLQKSDQLFFAESEIHCFLSIYPFCLWVDNKEFPDSTLCGNAELGDNNQVAVAHVIYLFWLGK